VQILHSPTHPLAKGTPEIREAIHRVKERGYEVDYVEAVNLPNAEVLRKVAECDFVVDQIYSDTPLAGFATEAASLGKPAVVGGYGLDTLKHYVPEGMYAPSRTCHPTVLEDAIEELVRDPDARMRLGKAAGAFVRDQWNVVKVAQRYIRLLARDIPAEWWTDPESIRYVYGGGLSRETASEVVGGLVRTRGVRALHLSHRPALEKAFLDLAQLTWDASLPHPTRR
jgi:hypothetical protein